MNCMNIPIMWIVFFAALILFAALGIILVYHWMRYSFSATFTTGALIHYLVGGTVSLGLMLLSIIALSV